MCFSVYTYLSRDRIRYYEVINGGIVNDSHHTGIILRKENVQYSDNAGYINYYIRDSKRAAVGSRIYSLDETGNLTSFLSDNKLDEIKLDESNFHDIKKKLSIFSMSLTDDEFFRIYDTKYSLDSDLLEYYNLNSIENFDELMQAKGINYTQVRAPLAGIVSFNIDSLDEKKEDEIVSADFDKSNYQIRYVKSGELVESKSPVYKIINSEAWSIIFPLEENEKEIYSEGDILSIYFKDRDLTLKGVFGYVNGADGIVYGKLSFDKFMILFSSSRFVDFEISTKREMGLKIPKSSVVEKDFYVIPLDYLSRGGDSLNQGFLKEVYDENGTSIVFVPTDIYYASDEYYYINISDDTPIKAGDYIVKPDSQDRYQIQNIQSLEGVYNINKGYATFRRIEVISNNDEYYTVKKNTKYGLSVYDHILLNGSKASEGDFIYK